MQVRPSRFVVGVHEAPGHHQVWRNPYLRTRGPAGSCWVMDTQEQSGPGLLTAHGTCCFVGVSVACVAAAASSWFRSDCAAAGASPFGVAATAAGWSAVPAAAGSSA